MEKRYGYITPYDYAKAAENGINAKTLYQRVETYGWDIDRATLETPRKPKTFEDTWNRLKDVAEKNGITRDVLYHRINTYKWSEEKASTIPKNRAVRRSMFTESEEKKIIQNGLNLNIVRTRMRKQGWSKERAINTPKMSLEEQAKRIGEGTRAYHERRNRNVQLQALQQTLENVSEY